LLAVNSLLTRRWPSTAETCRHRQTKKLRSSDSCVLTDPSTLIEKHIWHSKKNSSMEDPRGTTVD